MIGFVGYTIYLSAYTAFSAVEELTAELAKHAEDAPFENS
jgi:hypothetical protein